MDEENESNVAFGWESVNQGQLSDGWFEGVEASAVVYYGCRQLAFEWERIAVT